MRGSVVSRRDAIRRCSFRRGCKLSVVASRRGCKSSVVASRWWLQVARLKFFHYFNHNQVLYSIKLHPNQLQLSKFDAVTIGRSVLIEC